MKCSFLWVVLLELCVNSAKLVSGGESSQVVLQLVVQKTDFWDKTRCILVTFDVDQTFLANLVALKMNTSSTDSNNRA